MSHPGHARHSEAMPTFVIEARDSLALETVAYYSELCDRYGLADRSDQATAPTGRSRNGESPTGISAKTAM